MDVYVWRCALVVVLAIKEQVFVCSE